LRSDQVVQTILDHLDAKVGKGQYILALTADHGVCPLPEVARQQGKEAGRVPSELLASRAEAFLNKTFPKKATKGPSPFSAQEQPQGRWLAGRTLSWVYLNRALLQQRELDAAQVEAALADWLKQQPGVMTAYTRTELVNGLPADDRIGASVRRSFHPDRSGDVKIVLKPYFLFSTVLGTGTNHGTPHPYDTHVPLLIYGPGVRSGIHPEPVTPQATATILARALGVKAPARAQAPLPEELFTSP
jgi:hypothetical protein